jgi:hypothetical protein
VPDGLLEPLTQCLAWANAILAWLMTAIGSNFESYNSKFDSFLE